MWINGEARRLLCDEEEEGGTCFSFPPSPQCTPNTVYYRDGGTTIGGTTIGGTNHRRDNHKGQRGADRKRERQTGRHCVQASSLCNQAGQQATSPGLSACVSLVSHFQGCVSSQQQCLWGPVQTT
ncbi:unnamed protein product [Pleuronectes platessa]|uniref:Uncharacterized protein n=1 Tax=Pleuronectes platessa TaxID=8262 RepID=A0A9N7VLX9_PLEPL|nr:unnamed protein product [Pleuronectes platessa]